MNSLSRLSLANDITKLLINVEAIKEHATKIGGKY